MADLRAMIENDSLVTVESRDEANGTLTVSVKTNDGESRFLVFSGVSYVQLAPSIRVRGVGTYRRPCPDFLNVPVGEGEHQFVLGDPQGRAYCVVARAVEAKHSS